MRKVGALPQVPMVCGWTHFYSTRIHHPFKKRARLSVALHSSHSAALLTISLLLDISSLAAGRAGDPVETTPPVPIQFACAQHTLGFLTYSICL
jgi:hypothetical protein